MLHELLAAASRCTGRGLQISYTAALAQGHLAGAGTTPPPPYDTASFAASGSAAGGPPFTASRSTSAACHRRRSRTVHELHCSDTHQPEAPPQPTPCQPLCRNGISYIGTGRRHPGLCRFAGLTCRGRPPGAGRRAAANPLRNILPAERTPARIVRAMPPSMLKPAGSPLDPDPPARGRPAPDAFNAKPAPPLV